ncbi:MAG: PAS domain S-box protein [Acidobacteriia bacterium]|nr:PAS domain S-box protein [Terriglobia bacterium]
MNHEARILLVRTSPTDAELIERQLRRARIDFTAKRVGSERAFAKKLKDFAPNIILAMEKRPAFGARRAAQIVRPEKTDIPWILITDPRRKQSRGVMKSAGVPDATLISSVNRISSAVRAVLRKESRESAGRSRRKAEPRDLQTQRTPRSDSDQTPRSKSLQTSEERFRLLVESVRDYAIFMLDRNGNVTSWNPGAEHIKGYGSEEIIGRNFSCFYNAADAQADKPRKQLRTAAREGWLEDEGWRIRKDGSQFWANVVITALRDRQGRLRGFSKVTRDMTEGKRAEESIRTLNQELERRMAELDALNSQFEASRTTASRDLQNSEQRYRLLVERLSEVIFQVDPNRRWIFLNPAWGEITGFTVEASLGKPLLDYVHPGDRNYITEKFETLFEHPEEDCHCEVRYLTRGGEIKWIETHARPMVDPANKIIGVSGTLADITERKHAEEALRESEELYLTTFDEAPVGITHTGMDGRFLVVNRRLCDILGYTQDELLSMRFQDISYPEEVEADLVARRQLLMREIPSYSAGKRYRREDGSTIWVHLTVSLRRDSSGEPRHFISVVEDISRRRQAEEALTESALRYRELFENANDIIFTTDLTGLFTSLNKAGEDIFGYTRQEALRALNFAQLVVPEDAELAHQILNQEAAEGSAHTHELDVVAKSGRRIKLEISSRPIRQGKETVGVQVIARDVTERRALEEELQHSQKMDAVGRLAGGMAHDFNNILTTITGYSNLLAMQFNKEDPHRRSLDEIKKAADRATALTRQLLTFSRKQVLKPTVLDLNLIADAMNGMLHRLVGEDIELVTHLDPSLGRVKADAGQMEQVIMNLVVNARDAMPQGGRLIIETRNVELEESFAHRRLAYNPGPYVMLAVSDTGVGMNKETQDRIFEPFFTTKERGKGTGLGLSTVFGIVKQSAGNVSVYSEPGRGTTIKIYLPRVEEPLSETQKQKSPVFPRRGSETILLVEDEGGVRALVRETLEMNGYTVLEARNSKEAVKLCEQSPAPIQMILSDVVMPEMNGPELVKLLQSRRPALKVLFMSGYTDDVISHHAILNSSTSFLEKPFTPDILVRKVREILDTGLPSPPGPPPPARHRKRNV